MKKAVIVLSIIVPLSLLVTLRFTGILQGPINPETYTAETVTWNITRPDRLTPLDKTLINRYNDHVLSTTFKVYAGHYEENYVWGEGSCHSDSILFSFEASANIAVGFIHSFVIRFSQVDASAAFDVYEDGDHIFLHNVTLGAISQAWTKDNGYIEAYATKNRNCCNLTMFGQWILYDENNANHDIVFTLETLYYNGTAYRKAEMPIQISVQILT
jgi:hypothetical protein